jgi:hypothetical protein
MYFSHQLNDLVIKDTWARDDPAFLLIQIPIISAMIVAIQLVFHVSLWNSVKHWIFKIFVEFLLGSMAVASITCFIANRFLKKATAGNQDVEWLYSFDIHLNSYFPCFLITQLIGYILLPLIVLEDSLISIFIGNTLYFCGCAIYCYITFRGYAELNYLNNLEVFTYPVFLFFIIWISGFTFKFNLFKIFLYLYIQ